MEHSVDSLLLLARRFAALTGKSLAAIGTEATGSHQFFKRLEAGVGYHSKSGDAAMRWFSSNWPGGEEWPLAYRPAPPPTPDPERTATPERAGEAA